MRGVDGAGLLIGILQSLLYYVSTQSWFPTDKGAALPGISALLTFLIIVLALYLRGTPVRQGEPAPRPARDAGLLWLGADVALWGVTGGLLLLPLPEGLEQALRTVLSSANSACLLISASHLDYGPALLMVVLSVAVGGACDEAGGLVAGLFA